MVGVLPRSIQRRKKRLARTMKKRPHDRHEQSPDLLVKSRSDAPEARGVQVRSVQWWARAQVFSERRNSHLF